MPNLDSTLTALAQRLGMTVDHLWPLMVSYYFYTSLIWLIVDPLFLLVCLVACKRLWTKTQEKDTYGNRVDFYDPPAFVVGIASLVVLLIIGVTYTSVILGVINPEAGAAWQIIGSK